MAVPTMTPHGGGDPVVDALIAAHDAFLPELVRRCQRVVGDRATAEELAQDAFLRGYERRAEIDLDRPIEAWLTTVATRLALDTLRRRRRYLAQAIVGDLPGSDATFDDVARRDARRRLGAALDSLSDHHRRALIMFGVDGLSYEEIAEKEGLSLSAVKMTLHRARARLRATVGPSDLLGTLPLTLALGRLRARIARFHWARSGRATRRAGLAQAPLIAAAAPALFGAFLALAPIGNQGEVAMVRADRSPGAHARSPGDSERPPGSAVVPTYLGGRDEKQNLDADGASASARVDLAQAGSSGRAQPRTVCLGDAQLASQTTHKDQPDGAAPPDGLPPVTIPPTKTGSTTTSTTTTTAPKPTTTTTTGPPLSGTRPTTETTTPPSRAPEASESKDDRAFSWTGVVLPSASPASQSKGDPARCIT